MRSLQKCLQHPTPFQSSRLPSRHKWDVPGFALITGTASGVYKGCATTFTTNGAAGVALLNTYQDALVAVKIFIDERQSKSGRHLCRLDTHTVDVTNEQAGTQTIENTARAFNRLDYIIIVADIAFKREDGAASPIPATETASSTSISQARSSSYEPPKTTLQQFPLFSSIDSQQLQRGFIVNSSSIQGVIRIPLSMAYTVAKHSVQGSTRTASQDHAKDRLRINAICPCYTETPMTMASSKSAHILSSQVLPLPTRLLATSRLVSSLRLASYTFDIWYPHCV